MAKITPIFKGEIKSGKLYFDDRHAFDNYIRHLKDRVSVTVKETRRKRTTGKMDEISNQNGYLWSVVYPLLCDYFGYDIDEMHEAIKFKFLRIGGTDELPKIRSTTTLNRGEWEELMGKIRMWAASEYNIYIPTPNECDYEK